MIGASAIATAGSRLRVLGNWTRARTGRHHRLATLSFAGAALVGAVQLLPWRVGVVRGTSMTPTFQPGDVFVYSQALLPAGPLRRGDVVVLRHNGETWIKRVYAAEGDRFWAYYESDGETTYHLPILAKERLRFDRLAARVRAGKHSRARVFRMTMPPGKLFVMGDSAVSEDSRTLGAFDADEVIGRVVAAPGRQIGRAPLRQELSWLTPAPHPASASKPRKTPQVATARV